MRVLALSFVILAASMVPSSVPPDEGAGWSKPVDGIQARFTFEKGELVNRTRLVQVFVELRNISGEVTPAYINYNPSTSVRAQLSDSAGSVIDVAKTRWNLRFLIAC